MFTVNCERFVKLGHFAVDCCITYSTYVLPLPNWIGSRDPCRSTNARRKLQLTFSTPLLVLAIKKIILCRDSGCNNTTNGIDSGILPLTIDYVEVNTWKAVGDVVWWGDGREIKLLQRKTIKCKPNAFLQGRCTPQGLLRLFLLTHSSYCMFRLTAKEQIPSRV